MDRPLVALVLAGGIGSRLYPASRSHRPKQFLPLLGEESLLTRTVVRAGFADEVVVVTREAFAEEAREHAARADPDARVLVEPAGRETGPALVYATHEIRERVGECVVLALPSDHHVADADDEGEGDDDAGGPPSGADADGRGGTFEGTMRTGARVAAETGALVAFGVEPARPDTGYGYVEPGMDRGDHADLAAFHEKPDAETAERYVEAGYYWNAGIFAWTPAALLAAARDSPLGPLVGHLERGDPAGGYASVEPLSIDYAVMERVEDAAVVPARFEWDDLGSWDALARLLPADDDGNVSLGESLTVDGAGNVIASDDAHVSLVGVSDLAVVAWEDRVLVVPVEAAQRVREVVDRLRESGQF